MRYIILILVFILAGCGQEQVSISKEFRHNTIASLPIVELADNQGKGDIASLIFYSRYEQCVSVLTSQCGENKKCISKVEFLCANGKQATPECSELRRWSKKFKKNLCFTCWGTWKEF